MQLNLYIQQGKTGGNIRDYHNVRDFTQFQTNINLKLMHSHSITKVVNMKDKPALREYILPKLLW